ncbi:Hypothetical protein HVR_LOCUS503 [uncultured virus]|nr:Hypothetical protein HVR_LOCUS503 [uncultured virus]
MSNLTEHEEFGSCSECGQCNMTADAKQDVILYKGKDGFIYCDRCCDKSRTKPNKRKHQGFGSCNRCGQCNMTADPKFDVTLYTDGYGGVYCDKCL